MTTPSSHTEPVDDYYSWESVKQHMKELDNGLFLFGVTCGAGTDPYVMDIVKTIRDKTGAGVMEAHLAQALSGNDIERAITFLTEHPEDFKAKANELYAQNKNW